MSAVSTSVTAERILTGPNWEAFSGDHISVLVADGLIESLKPAGRHALDNRRHGTLLLPALSNGHDHGRGLRTLAYGAMDQALEIWLPAMRSHPPVDPYLLAAGSYVRLVGSGVGSVLHSHSFNPAFPPVEEAAAVSRAARDIGIRLGFGVPLMDRNRLFYGGDELVLAGLTAETRDWVERKWLLPVRPTEDLLDVVEEIAEACEDELVSVQFAPVGPQWCSDELLEAIAERSDRTGRRVHMHFLETRYQREWADAVYKQGVLAHLDSIGLLTPKLTLAHGVWLRPDEAETLAERGVTVVINTSSNLRLRSGIAPLSMLKAAGVRFAVGLDGLTLDDDDDAFREMRLSHTLHAGEGLEAVLTEKDILTAICSTGPSLISDHAEGFGIVDSGHPADLVTLDYGEMAEDRIGRDGFSDAQLVLSRATRRHVRDVTVAGRLIYENGSVLGIDESELVAELYAQARSERRDDRSTEALKALRAELVHLYKAGRHRSNA